MSYESYEVRVYPNGNKFWFLNRQYHREDGPAIEFSRGGKEWYQHGELHRVDGPAIECANGSKFWFQNGKRHREDGPAIEYSDGDKEWYLHGEELTEEEFKKRTVNSCDGKVVEIEGKRYRLVEE